MKAVKWTPTKIWLTVLGSIAGLAIVYKFTRGGINFGKSLVTDIKQDQQLATLNNIAQAAGIDQERTIQLVNIANSIYKAFHDNDWFGFSEDETAAVASFNDIRSIQEAKAVARIYRDSYGKSLYSDMDSYVNSWNDTPNSYFMNAIKGI